MRCARIKLHTCETYKRFSVIYTAMYRINLSRHWRFACRINEHHFRQASYHQIDIYTNANFNCALFSIYCVCVRVCFRSFVRSVGHACVHAGVCVIVDALNQNGGHGYMDYDKKSHCHWILCVCMVRFAL